MTPVRLERDGGLAVLTLAAPPLNLFDDAVIGAIDGALVEAGSDPSVRALLFRAEGRAVSAGVDVHLFDGQTPQTGTALFRRYLAVTHRIEALPFPTVFAAHALCLTAAFELALACDLLLAAESARFGLVEATVGLTPAMGGSLGCI